MIFQRKYYPHGFRSKYMTSPAWLFLQKNIYYSKTLNLGWTLLIS